MVSSVPLIICAVTSHVSLAGYGILGVKLGQPCPGACGLFVSASGDLGEPQTLLFLELDKIQAQTAFLGEIFYYYSESFSTMAFC